MVNAAHLRQVLRDPVVWTEVIQIVKTVVAAVVAWVLAVRVFSLPQPFLAPWSALLVVHATVYRTFWKGTQQVTAAVLGVILAWATGQLLGLDPGALALMLLASLVLGSIRWLRDEATTVAATALIVLTTGFADQDHVLIGRLLDTAIGVAVGLVVNLAVWPPLRDLTAARAIERVSRRVGELVCDIAAEFRSDCQAEQVEDWVLRTQLIDEEVDEAWALVRQARESGRLNPRRHSDVVRRRGAFSELLKRIEQSLAEIRSIARTVGHSIVDTNEWDDQFRDRWVTLLGEVGRAVRDTDAERLEELRAELRLLAADYSDDNLSGLHWPEYGGLILNLRNIATSMDGVAASNPVSAKVRDEEAELVGR